MNHFFVAFFPFYRCQRRVLFLNTFAPPWLRWILAGPKTGMYLHCFLNRRPRILF
jgi:hypothetical protein